MRTLAPSRIGHVAIAKLVSALHDGGQTIDDLVSLTGLNRETVGSYIIAMRREHVVHVSSWKLDSRGRCTRPAFSMGVRKDAAKTKVPRREVAARYYAKKYGKTHEGATHES